MDGLCWVNRSSHGETTFGLTFAMGWRGTAVSIRSRIEYAAHSEYAQL